MNITGARLGSKAKVSGRLASAGKKSCANSSRFFRTSTSAASMFVPQVNWMITMLVPCREVLCTVSTPSTLATARSIGSVSRVSMSCGPAPT